MTALRYEAAGPQAEFEPGSRRRVLRNLLGIVRAREMAEAESQALEMARILLSIDTDRIIDLLRKTFVSYTASG
jgi:hypothetical protein